MARTKKPRRFGYRVVDESINKAIEPGCIAIVEEARSEDPRDYDEHALLAIKRTRDGLVQTSCRRVEEKTTRRCVLACYSTKRRYARERLPYPPPKGETVVVVGRVVGYQRDL